MPEPTTVGTRSAEPQTGLTAVARPPLPEIITTKDQFNSALENWRERQFHVLSPFTTISGMAAQHGLIASVVRINPDPTPGGPGEVYGNSDKGGLLWLGGQKGTPTEEVALAKIGLRKIAECGGISTTTIRTDPRTIANYWEIKAIASYRGIDGALVVREATAEWDLRDGSDRLKGFKPNQITEARKNGLRNCEARAINAAIRECGCGLKQKYTRAELAKPFVILRVMFQPDMTDPDTRRVVTERALAGTAALYPAHALPAASAPYAQDVHDDADHQPRERSAGRGSSSEPQTVAESPYPDGVGPIQALRTEDKQRRSGEGTFTKWTVIDCQGVEHVTIKASLGKVLEQHFAAKTPVEIVSEDNAYGESELLEITPYQADTRLPNLEAL